MQNSVPKGQGGMVAVLGSTVDVIEKILKEHKENLKAQNSGCHGQRALTHQPLPAQPRARRTRLRRCPSQVLSGVLNFLSPAGAGRGAVLNSSFGVLLRGTA